MEFENVCGWQLSRKCIIKPAYFESISQLAFHLYRVFLSCTRLIRLRSVHQHFIMQRGNPMKRIIFTEASHTSQKVEWTNRVIGFQTWRIANFDVTKTAKTIASCVRHTYLTINTSKHKIYLHSVACNLSFFVKIK